MQAYGSIHPLAADFLPHQKDIQLLESNTVGRVEAHQGKRVVAG